MEISNQVNQNLLTQVKITNIFDERQDKVLSERWRAIMNLKSVTDSISDANMNIEHVKTALAVIIFFKKSSFIICLQE